MKIKIQFFTKIKKFFDNGENAFVFMIFSLMAGAFIELKTDKFIGNCWMVLIYLCSASWAAWLCRNDWRKPN